MGAMNGMEGMFRAMGLGQILDMAKAMAENGTFDKILKFSDEAENLRLKVEELIDEVKVMRRENAAQLGNTEETASVERSDLIAGPDATDFERDASDRQLLDDVRAAE